MFDRLLLSAVVGVVVTCTIFPSSANERLGLAVHRLVDACVGTVIETPGAMERIARLGRTATSICSCAAEAAVVTSKPPEAGFDAWAAESKFKNLLVMCTKAGSQ
ncbi:hypothetical protein GGQ85_001686 [Nitrobacter vulgaris]|uniref:hypothetical protein n=1 Tax=Nitrobacter vulgaris TaxID=29421 RepID=UPI002861E4F7|nr:hypothetical protein [Nitrobacter vulgaris]MDR6303987.1 hypothetical protein [Nitrobacter vulgaris]